MSGHFVVWRLSDDDVNNLNALIPGCAWSPLAHAAGALVGGVAAPGWTNASRALLNSVRDGTSHLVNRNGLPPHRYVSIPPGALSPAQVQGLWQLYWVNDLHRPSDPNFGLTALAPAAAAEWDQGHKVQALAAQIANGATSIEVYYRGGQEMY